MVRVNGEAACPRQRSLTCSRVLLIHFSKSAYREVTFLPLGKCIQSCTEIVLLMFWGVWEGCCLCMFGSLILCLVFLFHSGIKLLQLMQGKSCLLKHWVLIPATGFQQQVIWLNNFLAQPLFLHLFNDENSLKSTWPSALLISAINNPLY